jgi:hypothetical protein
LLTRFPYSTEAATVTFLLSKTTKGLKQPLVIEVEKPRKATKDPDTQNAVATLQHHLGFQYLMQKLENEKAYLQSLLSNSSFDTLEQVYKIQSGIYWINYLKSFTAREGATVQPQATPAFDHEIAAFNEVNRNLEIVGA